MGSVPSLKTDNKVADNDTDAVRVDIDFNIKRGTQEYPRNFGTHTHIANRHLMNSLMHMERVMYGYEDNLMRMT